jgi:NADH oxidase (H2O2-forming)
MAERIVVIGANSAGVSAASAARKTNVRAEIILLSDEGHWPYSRCGLPYVLSGEIPSFKKLILSPPSYYEMMKLDLRAETAAKSVDPRDRRVQVETADGGREAIEYDILILCTGASPFIPPIEGVDKRGVFTLRAIEDGRSLLEWVKKTESAVVVGAGFIGLELAHALMKRGIQTTVIERRSHVLPEWIDKDMADMVQGKVEEGGVRLVVSEEVEEILGNDRASGVVASGKDFEADTVLMATGARPRVELARQMGVRLGETGAVKVNSRMETSIPGVYAAGDCVESYNMITGQPTLSPLGTTAERQGKTAGVNAAGGYSIFPGVLHSVVSSMFDFEVGATGLTEAYAQRNGWRTVSGTIKSRTRAEYYPGGRDITVKVVAEADLGRIVGGQIIGGEEVTQRVNMLSIAIQKQMCVSELSKADTCYAPSVCSPWEPVVLAAENTVKKLGRLML